MIISRGRAFIFVHIPKTGGTSLATALEARAHKDDILIGDTEKAKRRRKRYKNAKTRGRLWKHSTLADIDGLVSPEEIEKCLCVTLVRNPWDRMVSYYHWLKAQSFEHRAVGLAQRLSFVEFLHAPEVVETFRRGSYESYMTAADGSHQGNLYIRLEHLDHDVESLWSHLGFRIKIPHMNRSERRGDHRTYYKDQDAEQLARICFKDIKRFNYSF